MKISIIIPIIVAILCLGSLAAADEGKSRMYVAKYQPVADFMEEDSTLSRWFKQYVDTSSGEKTFRDFLERLSGSEVLRQRGSRAGLTHNQLYSPIVTLAAKDWNKLDAMSETERAGVKLSMLELDIALAAIDATLPTTAHEEFRREVIRGAKPLTEVAKLPVSAVEAMTFTIMNHKVSDRINENPPRKVTPSETPDIKSPDLNSIYKPR